MQSDNSSFSGELEEIGKEIVSRLSDFIDPVYPGIVFSEASSRTAAADFLKAGIEGLIVSPLMWCEDQILRAALKELPSFPIILYTFLPFPTLPEYLLYTEMLKGSGTVGTLQLSGFFKREGYNYRVVTGYYKDPEVYEIFRDYCNAISVNTGLRHAICGILPFPCNQMSTTYVDEFTIRKLYGIEFKYLEISRFFNLAQACNNDEIECLRDYFIDNGYKIEVDELNFKEGIRYALAIEKIIKADQISILCMNDVIEEMHSIIGLRPCLYNPRLSLKNIAIAMEADVAAGIGMYILRAFTGEIPFYSEVLTSDLEKNGLILGHAGYHDVNNNDQKFPMRIVSDIEYKTTDRFAGAVTCFKYKPGYVTLINCVYNGTRLRLTVCEGESLDCPPKLEDTVHLFCKLDMPVREFFNKILELGCSQHFIVIPGKYGINLERLCQFNDIEYFYLQN